MPADTSVPVYEHTDTMTKATIIKDSYLWLAYRFRGSVYYHQGRKHGSIQAEKLIQLNAYIIRPLLE